MCYSSSFSARNGVVQLSSFFATLIANWTKTSRVRVLIFGTLVERRTLYSNYSKAQRTLTHYAARWRQISEIFENWQLWAPLPPAQNVPGPPNFQRMNGYVIVETRHKGRMSMQERKVTDKVQIIFISDHSAKWWTPWSPWSIISISYA